MDLQNTLLGIDNDYLTGVEGRKQANPSTRDDLLQFVSIGDHFTGGLTNSLHSIEHGDIVTILQHQPVTANRNIFRSCGRIVDPGMVASHNLGDEALLVQDLADRKVHLRLRDSDGLQLSTKAILDASTEIVDTGEFGFGDQALDHGEGDSFGSQADHFK